MTVSYGGQMCAVCGISRQVVWIQNALLTCTHLFFISKLYMCLFAKLPVKCASALVVEVDHIAKVTKWKVHLHLNCNLFLATWFALQSYLVSTRMAALWVFLPMFILAIVEFNYHRAFEFSSETVPLALSNGQERKDKNKRTTFCLLAWGW